MTINDFSSNLSIQSGSDITSTTLTQESNIVNIWSQILQEVQNSTKKSPPPKSIILLGDNESGRSTLVSRLKGVETISKGIGLEYHYIDIRDEDRDDIQKLGVWIPDGDGANTNLLKFALNESNIDNVLICFVVSMSTPWTIIESLRKWSNILREHLKKLNLPETKRNEMIKQQIRLFQMYQEPDEKAAVSTANSSNKLKSLLKNEDLNGSKNNDSKLGDSLLSNPANENDDDILLTLDPNILNKNLGLPIVVIVTKSDCISILDKEMEYRIEHFDFIQYHIRKFCLEYGAALFYTTVKDKRTHDKLYKYLIHKLYNFAFNYSASVVDRESIFIPSGWDNEGKINILLENSTTIKSDSEYVDVISKPSIRKPLQRDVETVIAQDDQEFLSKLQIILNKASTPSVKQEDMSTPQQINMTNTTPPTIKSPLKPSAKSNQPDSNNLKNFFQNLLNKNNAPSNISATSTASSSTSSFESTQTSPPSNSNNPSTKSESNA